MSETQARLPVLRDGIDSDATDRVVVIRGVNSSRGSFHALAKGEDGPEPARGIERRKGTYDDWDLAQAMAWRDPCWYCFDPDATPEGER